MNLAEQSIGKIASRPPERCECRLDGSFVLEHDLRCIQKALNRINHVVPPEVIGAFENPNRFGQDNAAHERRIAGGSL